MVEQLYSHMDDIYTLCSATNSNFAQISVHSYSSSDSDIPHHGELLQLQEEKGVQVYNMK